MPGPGAGTSVAGLDAAASRWAKQLDEFKATRTARAAVQQGRHLLLLKEASPHGTWRDRVNKLGLTASAASRHMAFARRFSGATSAFFDAAGSVSKLTELLPLEPEDVDALCRGEAVAGLTLEAIAMMSCAALRLEVRAALKAEGRGVPVLVEASAPKPKPVHLSAEEERMLRRYRKCNAEGRAALLQVAGLLEQAPAP